MMWSYRSAGLRTEGDTTMAEQTESSTYRQAHEAASKAVLDLITDSVKEIRESERTLGAQTDRTRDLAYAYRLIIGGPQPGSIEVSK